MPLRIMTVPEPTWFPGKIQIRCNGSSETPQKPVEMQAGKFMIWPPFENILEVRMSVLPPVQSVLPWNRTNQSHRRQVQQYSPQSTIAGALQLYSRERSGKCLFGYSQIFRGDGNNLINFFYKNALLGLQPTNPPFSLQWRLRVSRIKSSQRY